MLILENTPEEIIWYGSCLKNVYVEHLVNKNVNFYPKCIIGPITIEIGSFVLVSNADSPEPDTLEGCDVARIIHLYELDDVISDKDPCRAIVQWYSKPSNIPPQLFDDDNIAIDFNVEIVEDHRPFDSDISLETIFQKCFVISARQQDSASTLLNSVKNKLPMFVCRYKLLREKRKYRLIPLDQVESSESLNVRSLRSANTPNKTPKSIKKAKKDKGTTPASTNRHKSKKIHDEDKIDSDSKEKPDLVSPIKIIKNTVVKMSRNNENSSNASKGREVNANYLTESPVAKEQRYSSFSNKISGARRNLNISLENEVNGVDDSDIVNYSIIENDHDEVDLNEMKIKIRISEKIKARKDEEVEKSNYPLRRRTRSTSELSEISAQSASSRKRNLDNDLKNNAVCRTPTKKTREQSSEQFLSTGSSDTNRRKSILKTPGGRTTVGGTPKRNIQLSNIVEEMIYNDDSSIFGSRRGATPKMKKILDEENLICQITPRKSRRTSVSSDIETVQNEAVNTPKRRIKMKLDVLTPTIDHREKFYDSKKSDLQIAREKLHVSAIPSSLPCRETEFQNIYSFLEGKIQDKCGGCMYVSGVPGTGKTATITGVIRRLQREAELDRIPEFDFIEINGMKLTEPRQAYVQIYKQLTGKTVPWVHAQNLLEKRFTTPAPRRTTTVLLVDELDILCNRRQDVVYNLLDWPAKAPARLVVVAIANTMDLPERLLMGKVTSRLGLTRLTFQPYSHKQLQEIVSARLGEFVGFRNDAVQLVARKVAAVSGDARRALDICRRATEIAEESAADNAKGIVSMAHVSQALMEMIASAKVQAIKSCSKMEQAFLQAVCAEVTRTGVEETNFMAVYHQMESITTFHGLITPTPDHSLRLCSQLGARRLLICEHSRIDLYQKILLNVSTDDIHYALQIKVN